MYAVAVVVSVLLVVSVRTVGSLDRQVPLLAIPLFAGTLVFRSVSA